jgi:hypothetical protein
MKQRSLEKRNFRKNWKNLNVKNTRLGACTGDYYPRVPNRHYTRVNSVLFLRHTRINFIIFTILVKII